MKTIVILAVASLALPIGALAAPAGPVTSAAVADEAKSANINLEISGMR